jgi:hypothetical protein
MTHKCFDCGTEHDLRPYGPGGAMTCFRCAMSSPERKANAEKQFAEQLEAAGPVALIDGSVVGPYPAGHHPIGKGLT